MGLAAVSCWQIIRVCGSNKPNIAVTIYFDVASVISALVVGCAAKIGRPNSSAMPELKTGDEGILLATIGWLIRLRRSGKVN